jgi:hypothetical protein
MREEGPERLPEMKQELSIESVSNPNSPWEDIGARGTYEGESGGK